MLFTFTMNMASRQGNPVHQIHGEHPARDLDELCKAMAVADFLTVTEFYLTSDRGSPPVLENKGPITLNLAFVGKVKELKDHR